MKNSTLLAFSLLFTSITINAQITPVNNHPTQIAVEKWLNEQNRGSRAAPQICMVSVHVASTHNIVYWEKTGMNDVDYFKIFREDITGTFVAIDSVVYDSLSEYHDYGVNPNIGKSRYKITAVDTFGFEGPQSLFHGTMFCDEPSAGFFDWNDYEIEGTPSPVTDFVVLRKDTIGSPWLPIDTVTSLITNFTDINDPLFPAGEWAVRTISPISCTTSRAGVSTSRSNLRNKSMLVKVNNMLEVNNSVLVYPNPTNNLITLQFNGKTPYVVNLKDASGRIIVQKAVNANSITFNLNNYENGIYFLESLSTNGRSVNKIIKE